MTYTSEDIAGSHEHTTYLELRNKSARRYPGRHLATFPEFLDVLGHALEKKDFRIIRSFRESWPYSCMTDTAVWNTEAGLWIVDHPHFEGNEIALDLNDLENKLGHGDGEVRFLPASEVSYDGALKSSRLILGNPILRKLACDDDSRLRDLANFMMIDSRSLMIDNYASVGKAGIVSCSRNQDTLYKVDLSTTLKDIGIGLYVPNK